MKTVTDFISRYELIIPGMKILCAVSGGADSMCLLHYLISHQAELGIEVVAAHYEHGIRGEESLRDSSFVTSFCREAGVQLVCEHGNVPAYASAHSLGMEEAARLLRYDFLNRAAQSSGTDRIATAHNKNDNAETLLLNLTRGSGAAGLCGIPPMRGNIIRPLLAVSRQEILSYNAAYGVPFVEDSTNLSDDYTRNMLRHHVLPVLEEINPAFTDAALRTSELLRADELHLQREAKTFLEAHTREDSIPCDALLQLDRAIQSRALREVLPQAVGAKHVDAILSLLKKDGLCYCDVPGARVRKEQGRLWFDKGDGQPVGEYCVPPEGELLLPSQRLKVRSEITEYHGEVHDLFNTFYLNCGEIYGNLLLTSPRPGDALRILGRGCSKTLKKLFTESGFTQRQRQEALVLRDDAGVLAVRGLAIAERTKPVSDSKAIKITFDTY